MTVAVQCMAISTNALLAWACGRSRRPSAEPRVFYFAGANGRPLAGLMTFLAEAVDLPHQKVVFGCGSIRRYSSHQPVCFGIIFPFCHNSIVGYLHDSLW
jgi:hypothetical protein